MNLTTSDSDGEALSSLRKANEMLKKNRMDWRGFLSGGVSRSVILENERLKSENLRLAAALASKASAPKETIDIENEDIKEMFDVVENKVNGSALEFIRSLKTFFEENGYLTDKQGSALKKFYNNINRGRG
jgi:hypothetical protein